MRTDSAEYWCTEPSTRSARGEIACRLASTRVWSGFGGFTLPAIPLELYYPAMAESPACPQPVDGEVTSGDPWTIPDWSWLITAPMACTSRVRL